MISTQDIRQPAGAVDVANVRKSRVSSSCHEGLFQKRFHGQYIESQTHPDLFLGHGWIFAHCHSSKRRVLEVLDIHKMDVERTASRLSTLLYADALTKHA